MGQRQIYCVGRQKVEGTGTSCCWYTLRSMMREVCQRNGRPCVRYFRCWYPLHDAAELRHLLAEIEREGAFYTFGSVGVYYDLTTSPQKALPFIKIWEQTLGYYPQ